MGYATCEGLRSTDGYYMRQLGGVTHSALQSSAGTGVPGGVRVPNWYTAWNAGYPESLRLRRTETPGYLSTCTGETPAILCTIAIMRRELLCQAPRRF